MRSFRLFLGLAIIITSSQAVAANNPFNKSVVVTAGPDVTWRFGDQTATKSVQGRDGTWYHLYYDGLRMRLRLTNSTDDTQSMAKKFEEFAVNDVKIDGKRLKVFQWCLNNQDKHNRFLQQGLKVQKDICQNQGENGTLIIRMTKDATSALEHGNMIEFELKPFRTTVVVKFNISDFTAVNAEFNKQRAAKLAASKPKPAPVAAPKRVVAKPKPKPKCKHGPPDGYPGIKYIEFNCDDDAARNRAYSSIGKQVKEIDQQRKQAAAEAERKRKAEEAQRAKEEAERLAREEKLKQEQQALAASAAVQAELSSDITKKMLAVCQKQWDEGKHRCYCQKYIEHAPATIRANSNCK